MLLVERGEPGSEASRGNAGVLAIYECVPLDTRSLLKALPRLLFDRSSPLSISACALDCRPGCCVFLELVSTRALGQNAAALGWPRCSREARIRGRIGRP